MRAFAMAAGAALALTGPAGAQTADVRPLSPDATPAKASLADLKGLIGNWSGPMGAAGFSMTNDGVILGHLELGDGTKPRVMEIWILKPDGGTVVVSQKHFGPDLVAREDKETWAHRKLLGVDPQHIYLENLTWVTQGDDLTLLVRLATGVSTTPMKRVK
jgi:hypothetical protein